MLCAAGALSSAPLLGDLCVEASLDSSWTRWPVHVRLRWFRGAQPPSTCSLSSHSSLLAFLAFKTYCWTHHAAPAACPSPRNLGSELQESRDHGPVCVVGAAEVLGTPQCFIHAWVRTHLCVSLCITSPVHTFVCPQRPRRQVELSSPHPSGVCLPENASCCCWRLGEWDSEWPCETPARRQSSALCASGVTSKDTV